MVQIEEYVKMTTRREFLNELVKDNGLVTEEDLFELKFGSRSTWIIKRTGIEKIQYNNDIQVKFDAVVTDRDFAVIKATASKDNWNGSIETYGSAWLEKNSKNNYMAEMAEKRALARAVLKLCGAYKHGVYGEDEADDFKQKKN
jgi:hypothetical protein